jgi:hypothetical protein
MVFARCRKSRTQERGTPTTFVASPLIDPLLEPWESFVSNETGFPTCFEALYQHPLPLTHPLGASVGVMEVRPAIMDPCLRHIHVYLVLDIIQKYFCFLIQKYKKIKKNEILKKKFIPMSM